jgi:hypothetical protein
MHQDLFYTLYEYCFMEPSQQTFLEGIIINFTLQMRHKRLESCGVSYLHLMPTPSQQIISNCYMCTSRFILTLFSSSYQLSHHLYLHQYSK